MSSESSVRLMFLASQKFEDGKAIRGVFLLTDAQTKPLEFRCTNPIRPTTLQTVLYGDSLQRHIMVELIGVPLFNSLKEPPALVLVRESELLNVRPRISVAVIQIAKEDAIPIATNGEEHSARVMESGSGRFQPVILIPDSRHPGDRDVAKGILSEIFNAHDLSEPFTRISNALDQVHAQKIGEEK